jgi:CDP-diacylglycerol--glycerol-3-phosphate 3-phosphatidyltransferase
MTSSLRTSALGRLYIKLLQNHLLPCLKDSGITPDQMTLAGCCLAALAPFGFYIHPLCGLLLMLISGLADSLDGLLAREKQNTSCWGAFLDSSLDRLSDFFYLCGFWVLFWPLKQQILSNIMIFLSFFTTLLISYLKARTEALGFKCQIGLMERGARVVYLIAWALLLALLQDRQRPVVLWLGLCFYLALTLTTVLQRIRHTYLHMHASSQTGEHPGPDGEE